MDYTNQTYMPKTQAAQARVQKKLVDESWKNEAFRQHAEDAIMADLTLRSEGSLSDIKIQTIFPDVSGEKRIKVLISSDNKGWAQSDTIQGFIRDLREVKAGTFQVSAERAYNYDDHGPATLENLRDKARIVLSAVTREDLVAGINAALAHKENAISANYAAGLTV